MTSRLISTFGMGFLLLTSLATPKNTGGEEPATFSGTWAATIGKSRTIHGRWVGRAIPGDPSSAHGSWTLSGPQGKTTLTGTWSARKTSDGWRGNWSAKALGGGTLSGHWEADIPHGPKLTLVNLLERLSSQEITGTWRSGKRAGSWLLKGKARPGNRQ